MVAIENQFFIPSFDCNWSFSIHGSVIGGIAHASSRARSPCISCHGSINGTTALASTRTTRTTTNATLLTEKIITFFVEKNFQIMISLDGPEEMHDKHRRFVNGRGSYSILMNNLLSLRQKHFDYYRKLSTNTVLSTDQDVGMLQAFFAENSIVNALNNQVSLLTDVGAKEEIHYDDSVYEAYREGYVKLFLHLLGYRS